MKSLRVLFIFFLLMSSAYCLEYGIDAKSNENSIITHYKIFGERCSGTNFLQELIYQNLLSSNEPLILARCYGHKHYPRWFELPLEFYTGSPKKYTFADSENVLFLIIFRDPYDWLRSINRNPFDTIREMRKLPFSTFIRTTWQLDPQNPNVKHEQAENPYVDRNPEDGSYFENVMKLRSAKIKTMLEIQNHVDNVYYINYEKLRDNPEQVLEEIAQTFNLQRQDRYHPVIYKKGEVKLGVYKPRKYSPISQSDLDFINSQLDENLESSINYQLISDPKLIK